MEYGASAVFPCGQSRPSIHATALPHKSISAENSVREADRVESVRPIDERPPGLGRSCAGACRFGEGSGVARRTASVSWLVNACRVRWACECRILPRVSVVLLRCDWRSGARSTRGCAGCASTVWLTPHVRLAPLLRCDWRSGARSTRGCAGYASTMWLTPHVRLAPLLRCDWRSGARSTRGCAGCASTVWLTPHVRLACARIAFCWVGMSMVFCGTATCCSPTPTPGPSPATVRGVFRGAIRAGEGGVFLGAVPGPG